MNIIRLICCLGICCFMLSCTASRNNYSVNQKFAAEDLREDFSLFREILEKKHPSIYWYTSKDSMDYFFNQYYSSITDSMTEIRYAWHVLAPVIEKINCGHSSIALSDRYAKAIRNKRQPSFPLYMKVWNDTMAVTGKLIRKDSIFKRGTLITSINGIKNADIIHTMFAHLPQDGYANNINYTRLSVNFPNYHRNIFGLSREYTVQYIDSNQVEQTTLVPLFTISKEQNTRDSLLREKRKKEPRPPKAERRKYYRSLEIDSTGSYAVMELNSFTKGNLRRFFRKSFRKLRKTETPNLILDLRSNGGGRVGLSTLLTKYISRTEFKIADSLSASAKTLGKYTRYAKGKFLNNLEMVFISRKRKDGRYHIVYLEKKWFHPKKRNHYNGNVYVLIGGPTFSASTLFCKAVKGQPGITLIGEETGGAAYGNNGIMIPDITLPNTRISFRLPLYRLVQFQHGPKNGKGIQPDILVPTSYPDVIEGVDTKLERAKELIQQKP